MRRVFAFAVVASLVAFDLALAQPAVTDEDLVLRPGDKIYWSDPGGGHPVRFGGPMLTELSKVNKVLDFMPALRESGGRGTGNAILQVAIVKADADKQGVLSISFTCAAHPAEMRSRDFKIMPADASKPPRDLRIKPSGTDWVLEKIEKATYVVIDAP